MLGRRAKAGMLVAALLILAVEGVLLVRYYSGIAPSSAQTSEGTMPEGTVLKEPTAALADASIKATEATAPDERDDDEEASFVHRATGANSRGDYTYLDHPSINGDPDAVVLVVPASSRRNAGGDAYGHNIGVWYEPGERKWAVFNQDLAPVPAGSAFGVVVPPAGRGFVHRAASPNTVGNATYLDNPLTNGEPSAEVSVTQNWNPGAATASTTTAPWASCTTKTSENGWSTTRTTSACPRGPPSTSPPRGPSTPRGSGGGSEKSFSSAKLLGPLGAKCVR